MIKTSGLGFIIYFEHLKNDVRSFLPVYFLDQDQNWGAADSSGNR